MNTVKVIKNSYGLDEYVVVGENENYHENILDNMGNYIGEEYELVEFCESIGAVMEFYSYRQDKYVTKSEYIKHFDNYDSDVEYISPRAICNLTQAIKLADYINERSR